MFIKPSLNTTLSGIGPNGSVVLRHPRWADFDDWVDLRQENKAYLKPWEPEWDDKHLSRLSYRSRLARFKKMVGSENAFPFHIFRASDDRLIGACNVTHVERGVVQSAKLGYWVGQHYARKGFARASVATACKFCFETLGLHRVEAAVQVDNTASVKLLTAVGFKHEGTARDFLKIDGKWQNHEIYAKLSSD